MFAMNLKGGKEERQRESSLAHTQKDIVHFKLLAKIVSARNKPRKTIHVYCLTFLFSGFAWSICVNIT